MKREWTAWKNGMTGLVLLAMVGAASAADLAGLPVGTKAPDFELKDSTGKTHSLTEFRKNGPVALVFHRSADWCPFCQRQLIDLQANLEAIRATGATLVAVSYDSPAALARFVSKENIEYPLLSDPESKTITAYGLLNEEATGRGKGIPHPMTLVIDQTGVIRAKLGHEGYRERHEPTEIIKAVEALKAE